MTDSARIDGGANRTRRHHSPDSKSERLKFVCECGDPTCRRPVYMTLEAYYIHRPDPIIHPDHERQKLRLVGS
jgi:hypothetical protein